MSIDKKRLANKIYKLRKSVNSSQQQFADTTKVNLDVLQLLEIGEYDGNIKSCLANICKYTNTDKSYFDIVVEKVKTKNSKDSIKNSEIEFEETIEAMKNIIDSEIEYLSLNDCYELEPMEYNFYENESNTYQLRNNNKTRICAYCGREINIAKINVNYKNINYYVFSCNCKDFTSNCKKDSEKKRYDAFILRNSMLSTFDKIFQQHNFDNEYYDLLKTYFDLRVSLKVILKTR
jgi:DNA-binding XRE family transcriptional regulator